MKINFNLETIEFIQIECLNDKGEEQKIRLALKEKRENGSFGDISSILTHKQNVLYRYSKRSNIITCKQ